MEFFDTHCHLTAEQFEIDRDAVIQRALETGVTRMLTLGTDAASSRAAIALAERCTGVYAAVGIHPESVGNAELGDLRLIRELAAHPKVIAIGEIGLDFYWDRTTAEAQQRFFREQLELAAELGLPASVHDRDAHDEIVETLRDVANEKPLTANPRPRGVLHAFSGSIEMARTAIDLGWFVSFGGPITFKNNRRAPELVRALPIDRMLIETDSPYLTPHPFRGKRNEPAHIVLVAQQLAVLHGESFEQVAAQTTGSALALFRLEGL